MQCSSRLPLKESGSLTSTVRIWKPAVAGWLDVEDSWRELKIGEIGYGGDPNPGQNNFGYYPANTVSSASDQLHINSFRTVGQSYNSLVGAIADTFRQDAMERAEKDAQRAERESQAARERAIEAARAQQYANVYQLQMMSLMLGKPLPASFTQAQQPQPLPSLPVSSVPVSSLPTPGVLDRLQQPRKDISAVGDFSIEDVTSEHHSEADMEGHRSQYKNTTYSNPSNAAFGKIRNAEEHISSPVDSFRDEQGFNFNGGGLDDEVDEVVEEDGLQ